jgi:DNA-binding PucR family transcriptional regulator
MLRSCNKYQGSVLGDYILPKFNSEIPYYCSTEHNESLVVLMNLTLFDENVKQNHHQMMVNFLRENLLHLGMSRVFTDIYQLYSAYIQSGIALDYGRRTEPTRWNFAFDEYALPFLIENGKKNFSAEQICCKELLQLKYHDAKSNTCLYETLLTYIQCHYNAAAASKKLFVHRTTFLNRMDRIYELTNLDLDDWDTRIYLMLSFKIIDMEK